MTTYARNDQIRAYLFENGARICNPNPIYQPCMGIEAVKRSRGDIKLVECPDPNRYGEYVQVDGIPGQVGRWTTTLMSRLLVGEQSVLERLNNQTCEFDLHLNRGLCENPTDLSQFAELEVWEGCRITNYTTSALQALGSDQREQSTESVDLSFRVRQKVYNLAYAFLSAPSQATANPLAIEIIPSWCCGVLPGQIAFFVTDKSLYYTFNGGQTWTQVTPAAEGVTPSGGFRVGGRYVELLDTVGTKVYSFSSTGVTSTLETTISGVTTIDAFGSNGTYGLFNSVLKIFRVNATGVLVNSVDMTAFKGTGAKVTRISVNADGSAVAGFDTGSVAYSKDGFVWLAATALTGTPKITALYNKGGSNWLAGDENGVIWCTDNHGLTWHKVFDNGDTGIVGTIKMVNGHVGYASAGASLYRTVDGGATWTLEPADPTRTFITATAIADIAINPDNVNSMMLAVLATNARVAVGTIA